MHSETITPETETAHSEESIRRDLQHGIDKPEWPLSSYGPAKHEPNLISGLDMSTEEMRAQAYAARTTGNLADYVR